MTHLLFDLYGTLVDKERMQPCYVAQVGQVMAEQFGGTAEVWSGAYRRIAADWDSYYADLDLNGEHGLADLREGEIRVTRALFRLTTTAEPNPETLSLLARNLPYLASRRCDAFYEDAKPVLKRLFTAGYTLGIASHTTTEQTRGILEGADVHEWFTGALLTPDVTGYFSKNRDFFRAGVNPADCIVIDDQEESIRGAKAAGMRTVQIVRHTQPPSSFADHVLQGDLTGLLAYLDVV